MLKLECIEIPKNIKADFFAPFLRISNEKKTICFQISHLCTVMIKEKYLWLQLSPKYLDQSLHLKYFKWCKSLIEAVFFDFSVAALEQLRSVGVGYKVSVENFCTLGFKIGLSHDIQMRIPKEVLVWCPKDTVVLLKSSDPCLLGDFISQIKKVNRKYVYKNKGVLPRIEFLQRVKRSFKKK